MQQPANERVTGQTFISSTCTFEFIVSPYNKNSMVTHTSMESKKFSVYLIGSDLEKVLYIK